MLVDRLVVVAAGGAVLIFVAVPVVAIVKVLFAAA
jgi:hypothetical protein